MKPIHKFNGGQGATLCNDCRVIITTGLTDDIYCQKHYDLRQSIERDIRITLIVLNKYELKFCVDKILKRVVEVEKEYIDVEKI